MPLDIIVGMQWGDEGKGHITDLMAANADVVARFSGGDNAGHTVAIGSDTYKLHLIPSGIAHQGVLCVMGNGMVVNPVALLRELDELAKRGIDVGPGRLKLSTRAHLITPGHITLDAARERARGDTAIGTTQRGIGPAYTDKSARTGIRAGLLTRPTELASALKEHVVATNRALGLLGTDERLDLQAVTERFLAHAERLAPYLSDTSLLLHEALSAGRRVLGEGAQGTLLDLDHGTYPYVTSSTPTSGGAVVGLGIGPTVVKRVVGVAKAFTTRVGGGPFPCELEGEAADRLRGTGEQPWDEFGTTTGRPRRVGWLDTVILRYAARVNGLTEFALTKLDILSGLGEIPVCVAYLVNGQRIDHLPDDLAQVTGCEPIYHRLPGWTEDITAATAVDQLPANARAYVDFVAGVTGVPVSYISVGPKREQVIRL
jgi:adenylosuccinate synthase